MKEFKSRDKLTQRMTRDGAVLDNQTTGEEIHISERDAEKQLSARAQATVDLVNQQIQAMRRQLAALEEALAASEAKDKDSQARISELGSRLNVALAQRVQELGSSVVPAKAGDERQWQQALLAQWPARVAGPRPRRVYAALARGRLQARLRGGEYQPSPVGLLWRAWWAARG